MRVLGIDPSTRTGVSVVSDDGGVPTVISATEISASGLVGFTRTNAILASVMEFREAHNPDLVVIEDMFVGHASSAISIIQIGSILRYYLWQEGVPYLDVPATTLKKFVSGKGNSKKEMMMMHVLKRWGYESRTNNIADAVGLGMFGLCCAGVNFGPASSLSVAGALSSASPEALAVVSALRKAVS